MNRSIIKEICSFFYKIKQKKFKEEDLIDKKSINVDGAVAIAGKKIR